MIRPRHKRSGLADAHEHSPQFRLKRRYRNYQNQNEETAVKVLKTFEAETRDDEFKNHRAGEQQDDYSPEEPFTPGTFQKVYSPIDNQPYEQQFNDYYEWIISRNPIEIIDDRVQLSNLRKNPFCPQNKSSADESAYSIFTQPADPVGVEYRIDVINQHLAFQTHLPGMVLAPLLGRFAQAATAAEDQHYSK